MIALPLSIALLFTLGAPPPPPLAPEHTRPILEFWHAQEINGADRRRARDDARDRLAREYLVAARFDPKDPSVYASKLVELIAWLEANEPFDRPPQDENADLCAAEQLVGRLSPAELAETRAFFATPSGKRFWTESRIGISLLPGCYQYLMRQSVNGVQALHAVGLKAPPEWEGPAFD